MTQNIGAFLCGFIIAFYYEWRLTLVCLAFVPFIIITNVLMMSIFTGGVNDSEQKALESAGEVATEATINMRTVADIGQF
jgi:ABC-type multidrug transport system fused ATPase/permease subunit